MENLWIPLECLSHHQKMFLLGGAIGRKILRKIIGGEGWIIFGLQIIKKLSLLMQKL